MKPKLLLSATLSLLTAAASAQVSPHFSQIYAHPLWLNPALTGAFEGRARVAAIYRSQWAQVSPYTTAGVSADFVTNKNINIGVSFLQQSAGDAGYRFQNGGLSVAYSGVRFGEDGSQQLQIGLQLGFLGRSFDAGGLRYGSQWRPGAGYDPNTPSGDNPSYVASSSFDAAAGAAWYDTRADQPLRPYAGVAVHHLLRPEDPFYSAARFHLPLRFTLHGGFRYRLGESSDLQVQLLYLRQGTSEEKSGGAGIAWQLNEGTELLAGAQYRFGDAAIPYLGLRHNGLTLGASYDHTLSGLAKNGRQTGAFELSLGWILSRREGYEIPCPMF